MDLFLTRIGQHVGQQPDAPALSFIDGELEVVASLTYRQLDERARSVASVLLDRGLGGEPIVLSYPPGLDFVTAFLGCLYAGAIAVPSTLAQSDRAIRRLGAILEDSGARSVLTTAEYGADLHKRVSGGAVPVDVIATDLLAPLAGGPLPTTRPDQLAFLQYTSGSTRSPRGVMVRHTDLAANLESLREVFGADRESVGISWLPAFHDMGLIAGILLPLWLGYPAYLMAPLTFIRDPLCWLGAISRYRGTHGGAPNFAYQACVDAARGPEARELDLSSWQCAWNGAEPIRPDTLDQFREQFAGNGLRTQGIAPAYGLAEATLVVSGGDGSKPAAELVVDESELHIGQVRRCAEGNPGAKRVTGSGRPATGIEVRIVRPDVHRIAERDALGEIWVRSDSVAQGYWQRPEETAETFGAYLATGEGPYLRTGDLGFIDAGELFVIGRLNDMIVIRGVNHYPHDIEYAVEQSHPALQPDGGAVVGVDIAGRVELVAVHEIRRGYPEFSASDDVVDAIRRAVAREHQLALRRVVLLRSGGLPKTSSGKVERARCRLELDAGVLPVLHEWQLPGSGSAPAFETESLTQPGILERQLVVWLQRELSLDNLTWDSPLTEMGIDSLKGVELVSILSAAFDHTLPATSMLDHPTVSSLAGLIRGTRLGLAPDHLWRAPDDASYTAEQIEAFDQRELTAALQHRIDDVLGEGRL